MKLRAKKLNWAWRWPLGLYRVSGESMLPAYRPGHTLLGRRIGLRHLQRGQVVVARLAGRPVIKRVAAILPAGQLELRGDNPGRSTDSRQFGLVAPQQVEAVIMWRLP